MVINGQYQKEFYKSNFRQYEQMEKQRWEETAKRREEERRSEKKRNQKKEDAGARKGRKAPIHCVFPMVCVAPDGRKVGSLKRQMRSHLAKWEMKNCTPLWREAHFEVKSVKNWRAEIGSWDVEKARAVVAQSTFPSQRCKKLRGSDHFWMFRCRFAWQAHGILHLVNNE